MPPSRHAILSASSSHRWLNCPPSARLCETFSDKAGDYAAEGTDAHALCEYMLRRALGEDVSHFDDIRDSLEHYTSEMEDCADGYASYVMELVEEAKRNCADPVVLIEQRVDVARWVESGFGTADCIVIADGVLRIIDYKHGLGVLVEAEDNPQMKLYALGALEAFDGIYDIKTVEMTIYQPRRDNISTFSASKVSLYQWADDVLKPAADLAFAGEGDFRCGDWCGFCRAKQTCRARADANMELARQDFRLPPLLEDDEIEAVLGRLDELTAWANDVKEYALKTALAGKRWNGWKLVEGRSNRRYTNDIAVADAVNRAGYDPYEHKVLGITAMQKMLGRTLFTDLLSQYLEKPQGKPALVPESDKRPVFTPDNTQQAINDFTEEE